MKHILLLSLILLGVSARGQTLVTNSNVDIVLSQSVDDLLKTFHGIDNYMRTNGLPPYSAPTNAWANYKTFLAAQLASQAEASIATLSVANKAILANQMDQLQSTNAALYRRVFLKAFKDQ
jgi:hypothetical protein